MPSELMLTLEGHSGTVRCLDLNGNRLVSGSTDRTIKVWDLSFASYWAGASCKVTMVGHLHTVRCLQVRKVAKSWGWPATGLLTFHPSRKTVMSF